MCRWFAYISPTEPALLADVLLAPANAITKQCSEHYLPYLLPHGGEHNLEDAKDSLLKLRNSLLNMDGLGIAWYTNVASDYNSQTQSGTRPALYKSQSPPTNDFNFRSICSNTESNCLFAHIRASSGAPATPVNSHPFVFARHTFMHNGVISAFTEIRRKLCLELDYDAYDHIKGSTDSEHAAALYMTYLCAASCPASSPSPTSSAGISAPFWEKVYTLSEMKEALHKTILKILDLQRQHCASPVSPSSLNFCATDGLKVVACRFRNHPTQQPPSLYWSEFAGRTLNRKFPGDPNKKPNTGSATGPSSTSGDDSSTRSTTPAFTPTTSAATSTGQNDDYDDGVGEGMKHGKHTIIASEPTTFDEKEWHLIGRNCMLLVDEDGTETEVQVEYEEQS